MRYLKLITAHVISRASLFLAMTYSVLGFCFFLLGRAEGSYRGAYMNFSGTGARFVGLWWMIVSVGAVIGMARSLSATMRNLQVRRALMAIYLLETLLLNLMGLVIIVVPAQYHVLMIGTLLVGIVALNILDHTLNNQEDR